MVNRGRRKTRKGKGRIRLVLLGLIVISIWLARSNEPEPAVAEVAKPQAPAVEVAPAMAETPVRRMVFDRGYRPLAVSFALYSVYGLPLQIEEPEQTAGQLAVLLHGDRDQLLARLKEKRNVVWLAESVERDVAEKISRLELPGIKVQVAEQRYYPQEGRAAHVIGFVKDNVGLGGVEGYYDSMLKSEVGGLLMPASLAFAGNIQADGRQADAVLSLDLQMQKGLEEGLSEAMERTGSSRGAALVMAVESGELLAMVSLPAFNPNRFWEAEGAARQNGAVETGLCAAIMAQLPVAAGDGTATGEERASGNRRSAWREMGEGSFWAGDARIVIPTGEDVNGFGQRLLDRGRRSAARVDLPVARSAATLDAGKEQATLLEMASALALLANRGGAVTPHLLMGGLADSGVVLREAAASGLHGEAWPEMTGVSFVAGASDGGFWRAESLVRMADEAHAGQADGVPAEDLKGEGPGNSYQNLLVGLWPAERPRLVVALVVEEARLDPMKPPVLGGEIARRIAALAAKWQPAMADGPPPQRRDGIRQALRKQWAGRYGGGSGEDPMGEVGEGAVVEKKAALKMPNLQGYSLRKALQELQQYGFRVKIHGSGWVSGQKPAPGTVVKNKECLLSLRMERSDSVRNTMVQ